MQHSRRGGSNEKIGDLAHPSACRAFIDRDPLMLHCRAGCGADGADGLPETPVCTLVFVPFITPQQVSLPNQERPFFPGYLITAAAATPVHAGSVSQSAIQPFPSTDNLPTGDDYSVLTRHGSAIKIHVKTSGLDALSPYTVWAVIFNNPQYCLSSPCTGADLPVFAGHDPRVEASIVYAGGGLSDANGFGNFVGRVFPTRRGISTERLFGHGLLQRKRAEIHVVVRGHGYPQADDIFSAIGSFAGGCNAENTHPPLPCEDQQFAIHPGQ